jgi:hypothetical protein
MTVLYLMKLWWCTWHLNISHLWKLLAWNGILYCIIINNLSCRNGHSIYIFHEWVLESINFDKLVDVKTIKLSLEVFATSTHIKLAMGCASGSMCVCMTCTMVATLTFGSYPIFLFYVVVVALAWWSYPIFYSYVANCMWCSRNNFKVTMPNMKPWPCPINVI